jgi:carboxyl-terminal processing protease
VNIAKRTVVSLLLGVTLTLGVSVGAARAQDTTDGLFGRIRTVYNVVHAWHKDGADADKFVQGAIKGGLEALGDPYTQYFSPAEYQSFMESLNGSFQGIGAYLEQVGSYVTISAPIKDSPAAKAGLQSGDRILEANGVSLVGVSTDKAVSVIRGEEGTDVTLKIERPSENRTFTLTITRGVISIPEVDSKMLDSKVGYIQISSFGDNAVTDFYKAADSLKAQGAQGLVIDLRQNGGGYLDAAVDIASGFVPKDEPVVWETAKGETTNRKSSGRLINLPVSVLVDNGTASASEILAGAIQDYGVGPLVGVKTFGKGTVQQILSLAGDTGGIKVTVAEYTTPKHRHVHGIGLTPDYLVENPKPDQERVKPLEAKRILTNASVGLDVLYLQYRLQDLGYDSEADGFYGFRTARAVESFARDNALGTGAGVDARFIGLLNQRVTAHAQAAKTEDRQLTRAHGLVIEKLSK